MITMKRSGLKSLVVLFLAAAIGLLASTPAHAMHISEGILPFGWCVFWFAVAAPFVALALRRLKRDSGKDLAFKPLVGNPGAFALLHFEEKQQRHQRNEYQHPVELGGYITD